MKMTCVPRELVQRLLNAAEWQKLDFDRSDSPFKAEIADTVIQTKALLDKPAEQPRADASACAICRDLADTCSECEPAQSQGVPVAWQYRVSAGPQTGWSLWHEGKGEEFKKSYQVETRPLYAEQPAPAAVVHPFADKVIRKLERFQECTDDGQGADIGRHWFDLLTRLGLLNRVQRSPALWEMTQQGEDALKKRLVAADELNNITKAELDWQWRNNSERYQYLRDFHVLTWESEIGGPDTCSIDFDGEGHDLDAAIDKGRGAQ